MKNTDKGKGEKLIEKMNRRIYENEIGEVQLRLWREKNESTGFFYAPFSSYFLVRNPKMTVLIGFVIIFLLLFLR